MKEEKRIVNLTIFLFKETITDFTDCFKSPSDLTISNIKEKFKIDGQIFYCDSNIKQPRWKPYIDELSNTRIELSDNSSNKAVIITRICNRIMAVVFGYGRSLLREDMIVRNFGLKVALNIIDQNKMRSINAATIEDMVVTTQRQASYSTTQDEFDLNVTNDIIRGITGQPYEEKYGKNISGKDSLVVAVPMELSELSEKLELYYLAYTNERYKKIGFDWVDNVSEVRDSLLKEELDFELCNQLSKKNILHLHIAPPETTDWERIEGFCYQGIGKKLDDPNNYVLDLDITDYLNSIKPDINIYQKIHKDKLYALNTNGDYFVICSIYVALIFQIKYNNKTYILNAGTWYHVEKSFFDRVNRFVKNIPISDVVLPVCNSSENEGLYNERVAANDDNLCLMDKKFVSVFNGPKQIEACDLFTTKKQLIHIKNKGKSAQLSHLFSQGRVAAACFISDEEFRKHVYQNVKGKLGDKIFDYTNKPNPNEFEIVYAIIDSATNSRVEKLPFFSKVNLMMSCQDLDRMSFKYSICFIEKS